MCSRCGAVWGTTRVRAICIGDEPSVAAALRSSSGIWRNVAATDRDRVTTGFNLADGNPWLYFRRPHIGATSWLLLAERRVNPFWLGCRNCETDAP